MLAGPEIADSDAFAEAAELAETLGVPVGTRRSAMARISRASIPATSAPSTATRSACDAILSDYDLMLCVGSDVLQMSVWSEVEPLPETTRVAMIGLRDWEMGKNFPAEIALRADVKETLKALIPVVKKLGGAALADKARASIAALAPKNWSAQRAQRLKALARAGRRQPLPPEWVMARLTEALPEDGIVVEEGLTSTMTLPNYLAYRDRKSFFGNVSGGIGWGIAAAVGIQIAEPARKVVAVIGDGSAMYSITALWSAANQKLPVVFVITNNEGYQILKNRLKLFHGNDTPIGMDFNDPPMNITKIAEGFGVTAERVTTADGFDAAFKKALAKTDGPTLLEVMVKKVG